MWLRPIIISDIIDQNLCFVQSIHSGTSVTTQASRLSSVPTPKRGETGVLRAVPPLSTPRFPSLSWVRRATARRALPFGRSVVSSGVTSNHFDVELLRRLTGPLFNTERIYKGASSQAARTPGHHSPHGKKGSLSLAEWFPSSHITPLYPLGRLLWERPSPTSQFLRRSTRRFGLRTTDLFLDPAYAPTP